MRGKRSKRAQQAKKALARRHRKVANRHRNHIHQTTARLPCPIATKDLLIKDMTASATGTVEQPGKKVKLAGLNRANLDTAPFLSVLCTKVQEAEIMPQPLRMLADGLARLGREPAWAVRPETPSRAAKAA